MAFDPRITNSEGAEFSNQYRPRDLRQQPRICRRILTARLSAIRWRRWRRKTARCSATIGIRPIENSPDSSRRKASAKEPRNGYCDGSAARKVKTCEVPIVFDPDMAASLLRNLASAMSGYSLYKGASFLGRQARHQDRLGSTRRHRRRHDPRRARLDGHSTPKDCRSKRKLSSKKASLQSYLLDTYSGKKLGMASTGNASRSVGEPPGVSPANFYLAAGKDSPEQIIGSVKNGLYVTEMIGFGVNMVTGDYSRGAAGLWIENGELAYPVEEITDRRQSQRDVSKHRNGRQRSRNARPHRRADDEDFEDDSGGELIRAGR